jgi:hypothetical protein
VFIHLDGAASLLAQRLNARSGHFMPISLLDSQLATLEPLEPDEAGIVVDIDGSEADIVAAVLDYVNSAREPASTDRAIVSSETGPSPHPSDGRDAPTGPAPLDLNWNASSARLPSAHGQGRRSLGDLLRGGRATDHGEHL